MLPLAIVALGLAPHTMRLTGNVQSTATLSVTETPRGLRVAGSYTGVPWAGSWSGFAPRGSVVALGPDGLDLTRTMLAGGP